MEAPTVAAITRHPSGGGIAVVSDLLWRVFRDRWGSGAQLLTMFDRENHPATPLEKLRFSLALCRAQALARTDFVLFSHLGPAQVQNLLPSAARRPYGVFLNGIEAWQPLTRGAVRAIAGADVRIAISRYTAERVAAAHPGIGPIEVCPLTLPPADLQARHADGAAQDRALARLPVLGPHVVLVVGRMAQDERYKGHDQLIEAWSDVVGRVPDAQLVIVGTGNDRWRLEEKAAAIRSGRSILFTGFVDAPLREALYQRAAVFALPSRGEGFGLVYLEAMARRLPCVGSVHDAAGEVVVEGQTGRLVSQDAIPELADTLATLLLDAETRRRMGDAGYERARTTFGFERFRSRLTELLPAREPLLSRVPA